MKCKFLFIILITFAFKVDGQNKKISFAGTIISDMDKFVQQKFPLYKGVFSTSMSFSNYDFFEYAYQKTGLIFLSRAIKIKGTDIYNSIIFDTIMYRLSEKIKKSAVANHCKKNKKETADIIAIAKRKLNKKGIILSLVPIRMFKIDTIKNKLIELDKSKFKQYECENDEMQEYEEF